jgi:hypothetical protein
MNHRYIKGTLSAPKVSWEVNLYLGLRAFHREWSLRVESEHLQWSVACIVFSQFLRSCHISSRLPCVDSLFLFIWGTTHMSQISSSNSIILRVRAQSIHAIGCHHLCVIHRDFLITSPSIRCCQLHYVKTSNRSRSICNGPLTPVTCTHICNGCYLAPVTDKRGRSTSGLASATLVINVDFW